MDPRFLTASSRGKEGRKERRREKEKNVNRTIWGIYRPMLCQTTSNRVPWPLQSLLRAQSRVVRYSRSDRCGHRVSCAFMVSMS
jgi:hypothetical protein